VAESESRETRRQGRAEAKGRAEVWRSGGESPRGQAKEATATCRAGDLEWRAGGVEARGQGREERGQEG